MGIGRKSKLFLAASILWVAVLAAGNSRAAAQVLDFRPGSVSNRAAEGVVSELTLRRQVAFLADTLCGGRATSTRGGTEAAFWISRQFSRYDLLPMSPHGYSRSFVASTKTGSRVGHNIVGMLPGGSTHARAGQERYIVVMAHYDNVGTLEGRLYSGADSNASGVVAMLSLAHMFRSMRLLGRAYPADIIFVGLDAKQLSMAGAEALYRDIDGGRLVNPRTGTPVRRSQISLVANLDILGSSLSPLTEGRSDFLIMLGGSQSGEHYLRELNESCGTRLQLGFDYYGSRDFTNLFLNRIGDQKIFREHGIPAVLFTSGITMSTNRLTDTVDTLNFAVMRRRVYLIYYWLEKMMNH